MKRAMSWLIGLPAAVILISFAVANRQTVVLSFDPFTQADPWLSLTIPLWAVLFSGIFIGLIGGGIATWIGQGKWRRNARTATYDKTRLQAENERLKRDKPTSPALDLARLDAH